MLMACHLPLGYPKGWPVAVELHWFLRKAPPKCNLGTQILSWTLCLVDLAMSEFGFYFNHLVMVAISEPVIKVHSLLKLFR